MNADCGWVQVELSAAHDEGRPPQGSAWSHTQSCEDCTRFATQIALLDARLAPEQYEGAPDIADRVITEITATRLSWWSVAAIVFVGLLAGALVGVVSTRLDVGRASDLRELFQTTSAEVDGLTANLTVVERGVHETVPERVYTGQLRYSAPEQLSIDLVDTTVYPNDEWQHNDVILTISNGDLVSTAGSPCPVAALPGCLVEPMTSAVTDQRPFDDAVLTPLEIVGPGRSLTQASGLDVLGTTDLEGHPTIQVKSTVAAVELVGAITGRGAWRELHPTDPVIMWLDEATLVPRRIEVFASDSPERELWQLRRGYDDQSGYETPIFILELTDLAAGPGAVEAEVPVGAPSRGFADGPVTSPEPDLPEGFESHRSGESVTADGARVETSSWSDGRSWVRVEVVRDWEEPRLYGLASPFVDLIDLGSGSVGYLSPTQDALAIHGEDREVLVTGSISPEALVEAAASLGVKGLQVPSTWLEASTVAIEELPEGTLIPGAEDWSLLSRVEEDATAILLSGGGARSVLLTQLPGTRLDPPSGPDFSEVEVRGLEGRHDIGSSTLEWVEDGQIVRMRSETVGLAEMLDLAASMEPR